MKKRLAAKSLYARRLMEIRGLMGGQDFALAKRGSAYQLDGDNAHKRRLYELVEQAEKLGDILKPRETPTPRAKAWQRAFWGSDMRETINMPQGTVYEVFNQSQQGTGVLLDTVDSFLQEGAKMEVYFYPRMTIKQKGLQGSMGVLGQMTICTGGGGGAQGDHLLNQDSSIVILRLKITHQEMLQLWMKTCQETNPRRLMNTVEFYTMGQSGSPGGMLW